MKSLFPILILFTLIACKTSVKQTKQDVETHQSGNRLPQLHWLIGRWENNSEKGNLSEIWQETNDSTYTGASYFVIQQDTVFSEYVLLAERKGKITYRVTIPGQNNNEEVCFDLTKLDGKHLTFENPKHDYPHTITYTEKGDSLIAEIFGIVNGERKSEQFHMKKKIN